METQFNPYHKWLGVPLQEQPANHYRLLGLVLFENDLEVIESAADRHMAHVRTFQTGRYSEQSQEVLNVLSAAKVCLLKPARKAEYDEQLRAKLEAEKPKPQTVAAVMPFAQEPAPVTNSPWLPANGLYIQSVHAPETVPVQLNGKWPGYAYPSDAPPAQNHEPETAQKRRALPLIVVSMLALLGFVSLSVSGGAIWSWLNRPGEEQPQLVKHDVERLPANPNPVNVQILPVAPKVVQPPIEVMRPAEPPEVRPPVQEKPAIDPVPAPNPLPQEPVQCPKSVPPDPKPPEPVALVPPPPAMVEIKPPEKQVVPPPAILKNNVAAGSPDVRAVEWLMSMQGSAAVEGPSVGGGIIHSRADIPATPYSIWFISLKPGSIVATPDFAILSQLKNLKRANFSDAMTDERLQYLKPLKNLQSLNVYGSPITDAGLIGIKGLTRLSELNLGRTSVTDEGLLLLRSLATLKRLDVSGSQVTEAGIGYLLPLKGLEDLNLDALPLTDAGLERLTKFLRLRRLNIGHTQITNDGLKTLRSLRELQDLNLCGTTIDDAGLEHLKSMTNLRSLILTDTKVTKEGADNFTKALPLCQVSQR